MEGQFKAIERISRQIGFLAKSGHELVITHGNAPQVGFMLMRGEIARHVVHALPLDICGADTQGATGYMLQQALRNWLDHQGCDREVITMITQVIVGEPTPDGAPNTKGIGPFFDKERALELMVNRGWDFTVVSGQGYQRVVSCLTPRQIVEIKTIRTLFDSGVVVVCSGGGGIPITIENGKLMGVEAVVDKTYTAFLLADELDASLIVFVSPLERIIRTFNFDPNNGIYDFELENLNKFLDQHRDIEDTTRHKLIASQHYLSKVARDILVVSPDQLSLVADRRKGIHLIPKNVSIGA
jgi:carbamate kinase